MRFILWSCAMKRPGPLPLAPRPSFQVLWPSALPVRDLVLNGLYDAALEGSVWGEIRGQYWIKALREEGEPPLSSFYIFVGWAIFSNLRPFFCSLSPLYRNGNS